MWSTGVVVLSLLLSCTGATKPPTSDPEPFEWTLIPAHDHMLDALNFTHLEPSKNIELFFSAKEDPNAFASSAIQQLFSTVALEHSAYIQHVSCQNGEVEITFDWEHIAEIAREWPSENFVLITNHESCNPASERGVYMVKGEWQWTYDEPLQLKAKAEKTTWEHVAETWEITYGMKSRDDNTKEQLPKRRAVSPACEVTRVDRFARGTTCGRQGLVLRPQILWRTIATKESEVHCAEVCIADAKCSSFAFHQKTGFCVSFRKNVESQRFKNVDSGLFFYDKNCWQAKGDCSLNVPSRVPTTVLAAPSKASSKEVSSSTSSSTTQRIVTSVLSRPAGGYYPGGQSPGGQSPGGPYRPSSSPSNIRSSSNGSPASPSSLAPYVPPGSSSRAPYVPPGSSSRSTVYSPSVSQPTYSPVGTTTSTSYSVYHPAVSSSSSSSFAESPSSSSVEPSSSSVAGSSSSSSAEPPSSSLTGSSSSSSALSSSSAESSSSSLSATQSSSSLPSSSVEQSTSSSVSETLSSMSSSIPSSVPFSNSSISSSTSSTPTSSAPSGVETLNVPELYLFSLFNNGVQSTADGNILLDLGANATNNPIIEMEPFAPEDAEYQATLRAIGIEAGLPSDDVVFQQVAAGLDAAAAIAYTSTPSNIVETMPDDSEPATQPTVQTRDIKEVAVFETSVISKRGGGIFGFLLGGLIDTIIDSVLEAICSVCHDVYSFYTQITDPLYVVGQICEPCRPALEFASQIQNPFGYAKDVLDWYFKYGKYDPQGINTPPPKPAPPPPVEAAARVSASFEMAIPSNAPIQNRDFMDANPDLFLCVDCRVSVPSIVIYGTVAVNIQQKRVVKSVFVIDFTATSRNYLQLKVKGPQRYRGSTGSGTRHIGTITNSALFRIDIQYTHLIIYDVGSTGAADVKFGIDSTVVGGHAVVDIGFVRIDEQRNWENYYNVLYPTLGYATDMDASITAQGIVSMNLVILGTPYTERAVTTSSSLGIRSKVIQTTDADAGIAGTCAVGETQLDAWVGGETQLVGQSLYRGNAPLGRRCLQLKSLALSLAPPQPYCGGATIPSGSYLWNGQEFNIVCSKNIRSGTSLNVQQTFIRSFTQCIDFCNKQEACVYARWESRRAIYTCFLLGKGGLMVEDSYYNAYAQKVLPPEPSPSPTPTPSPTSSATGRPPIQFTTLIPPQLPAFTAPAAAPTPPIAATYPRRNPEGYCAGLVDGNHTIDVPPVDVDYDVQCGTTIDWTGALLTSQNFGFEDCMFLCRYYGTDCQAIMMYPAYRDSCIILTDRGAQRYTTDENVAIAIKGRIGSGLDG